MSFKLLLIPKIRFFFPNYYIISTTFGLFSHSPYFRLLKVNSLIVLNGPCTIGLRIKGRLNDTPRFVDRKEPPVKKSTLSKVKGGGSWGKGVPKRHGTCRTRRNLVDQTINNATARSQD